MFSWQEDETHEHVESLHRQIFRDARTHNAWRDKPVDDETLRELYDVLKWGPTSANASPANPRLEFTEACTLM